MQEAVRLPHTAKVVAVGRGAAEPRDVVDRASFDSMTNTNAHAAIPESTRSTDKIMLNSERRRQLLNSDSFRVLRLDLI